MLKQYIYYSIISSLLNGLQLSIILFGSLQASKLIFKKIILFLLQGSIPWDQIGNRLTRDLK